MDQLQVECRRGKVRRSETDVLPLSYSAKVGLYTRKLCWYRGVAKAINSWWLQLRLGQSLPTPTMSIGVGRIFESVCLFVCLAVCLQHNSKTNDPKVFKLGILWKCFGVKCQRLKGQGHRVNNTTQQHFFSNYIRVSFTFARWRYRQKQYGVSTFYTVSG